MNLRRLKLFSLLAEHLSITRVSEVLRVSQSSVSHQLSLLQEEFGCGLYQRNGRGIDLTKKGWDFLKECESLLQRYQELRRRYGNGSYVEKTELLSIGGTYGPSASFLPSLLAVFQKKHPTVQVSLRTGSILTLEPLVLRGDVEVAVVTTAPESASLCVEPYRREQMVAFVSVNHPLASKERLSLAEILCQPLVVRAERGLHGTILKILSEYEREGFKMNVAMRCESPDAVKAAVRKKAGVGFLYKDLLKTDGRTRDFKILKAKGLKLDASSFVIYHKERALSANAEDFLKILYRHRRNGANEIPSSPVG